MPKPAISQTRCPGWAHFRHVADIGVHGCGQTPDEAFEQAATALTAIVTEPAGVRATDSIDIHCEAPDLELLLADWLNAIIWEMATRKMLFGAFEARIKGTRLDGVAAGEPIDVGRHQPAAEPKGATLTELRVEQAADGIWHARCVVDV